MKSQALWRFCPILLACSIAPAVNAGEAVNHAMVPHVKSGAVIDGVLSPGEWDGALKISVDGLEPQQNPGWNPLNGQPVPPEDLSYDLYLMHDGESFFVAFDVTDDHVSSSYSQGRPDHTEVWNDDCTEVFIDGDLDRDTTESTRGSPDGDRDWREGMQPHFGTTGRHYWDNRAGYKDRTWWATVTLTEKGYLTEYRFAFEGIDTADGEEQYEALKVGERIGFSVLVNDSDHGAERVHQLAWIGGGADDSLFRSQGNWGYATMMPAGEEAAP